MVLCCVADKVLIFGQFGKYYPSHPKLNAHSCKTLISYQHPNKHKKTAMTPHTKRQQRKLRNRERRRAVREEKRARPTTLWVTDPIEIVMRVLMARGLPEELARMIIFGYHALLQPAARALTTDSMFSHMPRMFDTWGQQVDLTQCCCRMTDDDYHDEKNMEEWYVINVSKQRTGLQRSSYPSPVSLAAACHTNTISPWRGNADARDMQYFDNTWGQNPDAQLWDPHRDCNHTMLWYRMWGTMNGVSVPHITPREFSFVRWLKEAPLRCLAETIEINRGRRGVCFGGTREQYAAVLMSELEWHSLRWWEHNR